MDQESAFLSHFSRIKNVWDSLVGFRLSVRNFGSREISSARIFFFDRRKTLVVQINFNSGRFSLPRQKIISCAEFRFFLKNSSDVENLIPFANGRTHMRVYGLFRL